MRIFRVEVIYAIVDGSQHRNIEVRLAYVVTYYYSILAKREVLWGIGSSSAGYCKGLTLHRSS